MTTTNTYNPLLSAFRELTTPQAFRWYRTQSKTIASGAKTIALRGFTTAQRLLSDSKPAAIAPHQEYAPAIAETIALAVQGDSGAVAGQEHALSEAEAIASEPELDDSESNADAPSDCIAFDEPEQEYASTEPQQAITQAEAIEPEPDFGDAIADDGEAGAALAWVDEALVDEDDTELRWTGEEEAEDEA
jgi:hypothetical protein